MTLRRSVSLKSMSVFCLALLSFAGFASAQQQKLTPTFASASATDAAGHAISVSQAAANSDLQTFTYTVQSSRDGNTYTGTMVGTTPFGADFPSTTVNTVLIPVILTTNTIAVKITKGNVITTKHGTTTFDPTVAQDACLRAPNDVPLTLMEQSPIFRSEPFSFGPTNVGTTQYADAFQRANFWKFVGGTGYHTLLSSPNVLAPVSLSISGNQGLALPAAAFGGCAPLAIVDVNVMSRQIFNQVLESAGVNSSQLPILLFYNTVMSTQAGDLKHCCILGFHAAVTQQPQAKVQTYAFIDFDQSGAFGPSVSDTVTAAHEVGEWMDDPFGNNPTPAWGNTGQVVGACQSNLEVGDPLTANVPGVTGANGFTYNLQELAFFSWFYGTPSIAANGWFSNNNTFTTDAGPVCKK